MKSIPPLKLYLVLKNPEFIWCQLISIDLCSVLEQHKDSSV